MRPQDIVVLLKIQCYGPKKWYSKDLAKDLFLSTAEVSNSLVRNAESGLLDTSKTKVRVQALLEFLVHGIQYVFPQRPGGLTRGVPTAHSHPFMRNHIVSEQQYIWPDASGREMGFAVQPLYPGIVNAVKADDKLYLMLALIDALRVGRVRERNMAIEELTKMLQQ